MKTYILQIIMIAAGLSLVGAGTYGIVCSGQKGFSFTAFLALLNTPRVRWSSGLLAAAFTSLIVASLALGGRKMLTEGLWHSVNVHAAYFPMLLFLMPVIGLSIPVTRHFTELITETLSSPMGYLYAFLSAFFAPPGNGFAGAISSMWSNKALHPILLYFLTVVPLLSYPLYQLRMIGLGSEIGWRMYRIDIWVALWLIPFFWVYGKFFCEKLPPP